MITSLIFYFGIFITSVGSAYVYAKSKNANKYIIFLIISFISAYIPAALRYDVGVDNLEYLRLFYMLNEIPAPEIKFPDILFSEYLYVSLNKVIYFFGLDAQWFIIIMAFLTYFIIFISFPKRYLHILVLILMTNLYFFSFNAVRQALSIAIVLYAVALFLEKKYIKTYILLLIAIGFHKSFLFFLPIFFSFHFIKLNKPIMIFITIVGCFLANFVFRFNYIFSFLTNSAWDTSANALFLEEYGMTLGVLLRISLIVMPLIYCVLFSSNKSDKQDKTQNILFLLFPLILIMEIYAKQIYLFVRFLSSFVAFYPLFLIYIVENKCKYKKLFISYIVIGYISVFGINIVKNHNGIIPYQTVLSK
ncbi:MAG: EpsG family protein [Chitinispirillales bacterium]|jgi:hypothetical protein|nr:EpsG family protein [Chitinispirillales bacterium]